VCSSATASAATYESPRRMIVGPVGICALPVSRAPAAEKCETETPSRSSRRTNVSCPATNESARMFGLGGPSVEAKTRSPSSRATSPAAIPNAIDPSARTGATERFDDLGTDPTACAPGRERATRGDDLGGPAATARRVESKRLLERRFGHVRPVASRHCEVVKHAGGGRKCLVRTCQRG